MLYDLQSERFIKNFLYPELKKIIDKIVIKNKNDSLEWEIFKNLCEKVQFFQFESEDINIVEGFSSMNNLYKNELFRLIFELQSPNKLTFEVTKSNEIKERLFLIYGDDKFIPIEVLEKNENISELKYIFRNKLAYIRKAIEFVKEIESKEKLMNNTLESLLDEI